MRKQREEFLRSPPAFFVGVLPPCCASERPCAIPHPNGRLRPLGVELLQHKANAIGHHAPIRISVRRMEFESERFAGVGYAVVHIGGNSVEGTLNQQRWISPRRRTQNDRRESLRIICAGYHHCNFHGDDSNTSRAFSAATLFWQTGPSPVTQHSIRSRLTKSGAHSPLSQTPFAVAYRVKTVESFQNRWPGLPPMSGATKCRKGSQDSRCGAAD